MKNLITLKKRKIDLETFLKENGTVEDGQNLYVVPYSGLRFELYWLEKFEKEVCDLNLIDDSKIFEEWFLKKNSSLFRKIKNKFI